jgi:hypothetical protein
VQFKVHAVTTNEIFLMVGDLFAGLILATESHLVSSASASGSGSGSGSSGASTPADVAASIAEKTFGSYVREPWWDAAVAPKGTDAQDLRDSLHMLVTDSYAILKVALKLDERGLSGVLSEDMFSRTVGMFEQNNVGVRLESPLQRFVGAMQPGHAAAGHFAGAAQMISTALENEEGEDEDGEWEDVDEGEEGEEGEEEDGGEEGDVMYCQAVGASAGGCGAAAASKLARTGDPALDNLRNQVESIGKDNLFPPLDGTAFYRKICKINHSCEPNVRVVYTAHEAGVGLRAQIVSLRPIEAGEELVQSYIDQHEPFQKRQESLRDYGFVCSCQKCAARL